jgi:hypothetical protein
LLFSFGPLFSFGVVILFGTNDELQMVKKRDNSEVPHVPPSCHPELAELITSCLCAERTKRPTFEQIVQILEYLPLSFVFKQVYKFETFFDWKIFYCK